MDQHRALLGTAGEINVDVVLDAAIARIPDDRIPANVDPSDALNFVELQKLDEVHAVL